MSTMRDAKGLDRIIYWWNWINLFQLPVAMFHSSLFKFFLIPNIIFFIILLAVIIFRIKKKERKFIGLYIWIVICTIMVIMGEYWLTIQDASLSL